MCGCVGFTLGNNPPNICQINNIHIVLCAVPDVVDTDPDSFVCGCGSGCGLPAVGVHLLPVLVLCILWRRLLTETES